MRILKILGAIALVLLVLASGFGLWLSDKYVVPIMMYHNVEQSDTSRPNWVSPERFRWHMQYLKKHGYRVIRFNELIEAIKEGKSLPRKTVVVTFDDGYANNYTHAFPILQEYQFPAILFVPSDLLGQEGFLTWAQLQQMRQAGIDIGSHTRTHAYLPELPLDEQREQIFQSKRRLEEKLGIKIDYFSYQTGGFNEQIKALVKEAGYKGACTTNRGYDRFNKDVYELKRIRFSDQDNRQDYLWMKLSGYYNLFREAKNPF